MTPERYRKVGEIFHEALEADSGERAALLDRACAGDAELRHEVESLIGSHEAEGGVIDEPAVSVAAEMLAGDGAEQVVGRTLAGRYRVMLLLGEGGMGQVYLAEDARLGRKVTLKLLATHLTADEERVRRFGREARAASALNHPNILTVHEIGRWEGRDFIAAEYVEGATLRTRMRGRGLSLAAALDIALQIAGALTAAHAAGIVHRDIKPENIMVRPDGLVKLLDFGIAKYAEPTRGRGADESWVRTATGVVVGTTAYMSPEQARGLEVDARTDVWSLGVLLYEMVARRLPFRGKTPTDRVAAILEREPEPLSKLRRGVPAGLERIVKRALAKNRDERYARVADLAEELRRLRATLGDGRPPRFALPAPASGLLFSRRRRAVALASLLLVMAGLASALLFRRSSAPAPGSEIKSLAVLPLDNLSGDSSQDYFADGMTEALIAELSKVGALRVISRTSVMRYKGTRKPLPEIARELNVDAVVEGSVLRSEERVRITVQLIQAATNRHLWAEDYERHIGNILALQKEVARAIAGEIRIKLTPPEEARLTKARPVNPETYDLFLRGVFHSRRFDKADNQTGIEMLDRAVALDPAFAAGHAAVANACVFRLFYVAPDEQKQLEEKAYVALEKAYSLDPDLAEIYVVRGKLLWRRSNHFPHERAIQEYRRALDLNPNLEDALNQLALVHSHIGLFEEALQEYQKLAAINPSSTAPLSGFGNTLLWQGKYEQALAFWLRVPREGLASYIGSHTAWALFQLGRRGEAAAKLEEFLKLDPADTGGNLAGMQAVLFAAVGKKREAEEKIKSAIEKRDFGHFHHAAYYIASAYALMDEPEPSIYWLEQAAETGFPCYPLFERDPNLDRVRKAPRFISLMANLKAQWEDYRARL